MKNRRVSRRFLGIFCLALLAALPFAHAWGYTVMGNDRILLMNDDTKFGSAVNSQGYYATNTTAKTYWVHDATVPGLSPNLLKGSNHTMFQQDGTRLWDLVNCRAGSGTVVGNTARNYIPWSSTAKSIIDGSTKIPENNTSAKAVGSVIFRNAVDACLYSPFYSEGIGTIYFDAVNAFVNAPNCEIALEIATNVTESAMSGGVDFATVTNNYEDLDWVPCPMSIFTVSVSDASPITTNVTLQSDCETNVVVLGSTAGGSKLFYRMRTQLNWRAPIRFRVRRLNATGGNIDMAGLILLDNIIASYPPMGATLGRYGADYDSSLTGADVLGCCGDVSVPFLSMGQTNVVPFMSFAFLTNASATTAAKILNPTFRYRWRYLNQQTSEWKTIPFNLTTITSTSYDTTNLVGASGLDLNTGVGDLEYFFEAGVNAPYYAYRDYAYSSVLPTIGYGSNWTEEISAITNRAVYTALNMLPSGGTDWFMRIREGASDYASVSLVGEVTTNGAWGVNMHKLADADGNVVEQNKREKMELVGDHTWRYHYYIPTNAIGERIRFHFKGVKYTAGDEPFTFTVNSNIYWYANSTNVPYLPYTMSASGSLADKNNAVVELDGSATHLQIDFNDEVGTFALSRGSYQNFNAWTDANDGYRGNYSSTTGVSDVKTRWDADIGNWTLTRYARPTLWREVFEVEDDDSGYPYLRSVAPTMAGLTTVDSYGALITPNGWNAENAAFVPRARIAPYGHSVQLRGKGEGSLMLNNLAAQYIPNGIGEVEFAARVAQVPDFDGFCYNQFAGPIKNYAVSAKVTMSRMLDSMYNPLDVSPASPSVSLVGYYQGYRNGCYEFRVTRSGEKQLKAALYRWREGTAELLVENTLYTSQNATLASGQQGLGVGGLLTTWTFPTSATIGSFNNLLVPMDNNDVPNSEWTCMCLSIYTDDSTGEVRLDGFLSSERNTSQIASDTKSIRVVAFKDGGSDRLQKGMYGIGSVGCQAGFGRVYTHDFKNGNFNDGLVLTTSHDSDYSEWDYQPERWRQLTSAEASPYGGAGFSAVIPATQTVKLLFQKQGDKDGWIDSGWETNIVAFATNTFIFAPCVAPDYLVRLETGPADAEIVIDSVEVRSWRASDTPNLSSQNGHYDEWAYTMASIEASAEIEGASYELVEASTNGYAFIFNEAGVVTFTPQIDMVIDRVLLVGGGGAGGSTMGGGGGGGGVLEYNWEQNPVTVQAGTTLHLTIGAGGAAPVPAYSSGNANSTSQPAGKSGGFSRVTGIPGYATLEAKGGGGGAGWSADAQSGGSGGGGSNTRTGAGGTTNQGNKGGNATNSNNNYGLGGGGGGAGEAGQNGQGTDFVGGKGGDGKPSDITGTVCYYGGGGGGGVGWKSTALGGEGGKCGPMGMTAGHGASYQKETTTLTAGLDGYGGGGGGGTYYNNGSDVNVKKGAGARGGCGCVIFRVRTASKLCVLQPTRSYPSGGDEYMNADYPMSVRSKYMDNGLSLFSFSYRDADSNAVLRLQISTNLVDEGEVYSRTREPADSENWTTLTNWSFRTMTDKQRTEGTLTYFLSLRAPQKGLMRLVVEPSVVSNALEQAKNPATRNLDYGKVIVTRIFCYDEPPLDGRSWWGWNLHTEGWGGGGDPGMWAYLTDSPDGLSCSLNFSARADENDTSKPENRTYGIGLGETDKDAEYAENNPFVQCPEMTNGVGSVSFRARTFETNATAPSVVLLYGSPYPDSYQPDPRDGQGWTRLAEFVISNNTYQTYSWRTNEMTTVIKSVRLEVGGARHGRETKYAPLDAKWEKPSYTPYRPIQRVFLDEVTVSEPVGPRLKFFDVRPFRDNLADTSPKAITNINSRDEQPLLGEAWGIQARIEPQQMSDELDMDSIVVKMAAYVGKSPWGYKNWQSVPVGEGRYEAELTCVDRENLIFRSTYDNSASVIQPVIKTSSDPYAVVQYHVWAEYKSKDASEDQEPTRYDLSAADWVKPGWYWPKDFNTQYGSGLDENFSAFTILDTISPGRAWFNEVNYNNDDYSRDNYQFVEFMVPEGVDLTGWAIRLTDDTFRQGFLAEFGSLAQSITSKVGKRYGIDSTNQFTVVTFVAPNGESMFASAEPPVDGTWNKLQNAGLALQEGSLKKGNIYGLELMRPSGVVEQQIVVSGTNMWAGSIFESKGDATNFVNDVKARDGSEAWFWAGEDRGGLTDTLGVWRGHGEQFWDGDTTWTNDLTATPGQLNLRNGRRQALDEWMLRPNGSYVWIDAIVNGYHTLQYVDGNPSNATNEKKTLMVSAGTTTNIRYVVDAWYEMANCTTNGKPVTPTAVTGQARTFEITLPDVTSTTTVIVDDKGDSRLFGTNYPWQVSENDPYKSAILDWLLRKYSDKTPDDIVPAEHWDLDQTQFKGFLDLKAMYWLDIPPADGHDEAGKRVSDWRLLFGIVKSFKPFKTEESGVAYTNNAIGAVKLFLTNKVDRTKSHAPYTIQGLAPGSSSATDYASMSENWTSATFKVTASPNIGGLTGYKPVKWFVFDSNSFNADGISYIEIPDQSNPSTPGFNYGWHYYHDRGITFGFSARLDGAPSGLYSTELLKKIHVTHTNELPSSVLSP